MIDHAERESLADRRAETRAPTTIRAKAQVVVGGCLFGIPGTLAYAAARLQLAKDRWLAGALGSVESREDYEP